MPNKKWVSARFQNPKSAKEVQIGNGPCSNHKGIGLVLGSHCIK